MGTGYTRADTSNNIADGNIINASDLDSEFDAVQAAFDSSTGHTHDGTSAEGAPIEVTGPNQEYVSTATEFKPKTNNTYDLGSLALQWKNLYVDGTAYLDAVDIDGGAIDGTAIGGSSAAAGSFTTLGASGNATVGGTLDVTGATTLSSTLGVTGATTLSSTLDVTGATTLSSTLGVTGATTLSSTLDVTGATTLSSTLGVTGATTLSSTLDVTGATTLSSTLDVTGLATLASVDINAGNIDGTTIGSASAAAGTFTTLGATTGNITTVNATTVDSTNLEITNIKAKDGTSAGSIANSTGIVTLASSVLTTTDINGGTIDGTTIATSDITVGTGKTLNVSAGTLTLANDQISGDKVEGGTINAITINTLGSTTGNITTVNSTTVDTTNLEVTNLKAKDGTSAGSIADSTGVVTLASSVLTTADINGGTIDGVTIGGASAGAITGTTITGTSFVSSGDMTFGDNDKAIFGAGSDLQIYHDGSNSIINDNGTGSLKFQYGGTDGVVFDSSGNVGIGTTSISATLNLVGAASDAWTTTGNNGLGLNGDSRTGGISTITTYLDNSSIRIGSGVTQKTGMLITGQTTASGSTVQFRTGGSESMRIDSSGNVGIGTSSPAKKLHVNGVAIFGEITTPSGSVSDPIIQLADGDTGFYRPVSGAIGFVGNGSERMRIDSSGNVLVGKTTTAFGTTGVRLEPAGTITVTRSGYNCLDLNKLENGTIVAFYRSGSNVGTIQVTATSTSYNTSSDYRLKEDVQPMVGASDRLMALKPVNFAWKVDGSRVDGFLAHEAQEVVPEAVTGTKDAVDKDGNPEYQGIDQSKLVPLLTAALQEALTEIKTLKARMAELEA